jgi:hypothetical protein
MLCVLVEPALRRDDAELRVAARLVRGNATTVGHLDKSRLGRRDVATNRLFCFITRRLMEYNNNNTTDGRRMGCANSLDPDVRGDTEDDTIKSDVGIWRRRERELISFSYVGLSFRFMGC